MAPVTIRAAAGAGGRANVPPTEAFIVAIRCDQSDNNTFQATLLHNDVEGDRENFVALARGSKDKDIVPALASLLLVLTVAFDDVSHLIKESTWDDGGSAVLTPEHPTFGDCGEE